MLKSFINATWVDNLTEDDLELINSEFIPKDFKEKESDLIYKAKIKDKEVIFYFLLELQSTVDFTIGFRLLAYMFELYKRLFLDTEENIRERADFRLPAIVPCVLYNGSNSWTAIRSFKEYLGGYELFGDNVIDFKYILLNVNKYSDDTLIEIGNLISSIFALDKKQDKDSIKISFEKIYKIFITLSGDEQIDLTDWIRDVLMKKVNYEEQFIDNLIDKFRKGDVNNMTYAIERMFDEVEEKSKTIGVARGKIIENIETIRKKLAKGMLVDNIADMLELEENYVQDILNLIAKHKELTDSEIADKYISQSK